MATNRRKPANKAEVKRPKTAQAPPDEAAPAGPSVGANGTATDVNAMATTQELPFILDHEFFDCLHALSRAEDAQLEANIKSAGRALDPLVVWKGHRILLDGHHRYLICSRLGLPFDIVEIELPHRAAAKAWIENHQRGRRKDTEASLSYRRGRQYKAEKKLHGGSRPAGQASGHNDHMRTEERVAKRHDVSARTIRRDAEFAEAIDGLASRYGMRIVSYICSGQAKLSRQDVLRLCRMKVTAQRKAVDRVLKTGRMPVPSRMMKASTMRVPVDPKELALHLRTRLNKGERDVFSLAWGSDESK
jgi:ParB-like chromosome segregation protein Spo0J